MKKILDEKIQPKLDKAAGRVQFGVPLNIFLIGQARSPVIC